MKKIINVLIVFLLLIGITGCSSGISPEEIGKYYVECLSENKTADFFREYSGDLYFRLHGSSFESREQFLEYLEESNKSSQETANKNLTSIEFVDSVVEVHYSKENRESYNTFVNEKYKDIVIVKVTFNYFVNGQEQDKRVVGLLMGKKNGQWEVARFLSEFNIESAKQRETGN